MVADPEGTKLPSHVAIIMDGNGRWARNRGLPRHMGHKSGVDTVQRIVEYAANKGISALTLFAFSSENWRRPKKEVGLLMELFLTALKRQVKKLNKQNVRLRLIGDLHAFSPRLQETIAESEALTSANTGLDLVIAANYGGHWDIVQAARKLAERVQRGELQPDEIDTAILGQHICLADLPEPDLFIRTGGERRISNFLLWQLAYTELYFTDTLWPDFDSAEFDMALADFAGRQRRFGQTGDQVEGEAGDVAAENGLSRA